MADRVRTQHLAAARRRTVLAGDDDGDRARFGVSPVPHRAPAARPLAALGLGPDTILADRDDPRAPGTVPRPATDARHPGESRLAGCRRDQIATWPDHYSRPASNRNVGVRVLPPVPRAARPITVAITSVTTHRTCRRH